MSSLADSRPAASSSSASASDRTRSSADRSRDSDEALSCTHARRWQASTHVARRGWGGAGWAAKSTPATGSTPEARTHTGPSAQANFRLQGFRALGFRALGFRALGLYALGLYALGL
eukprot:355140-Chlamydomonas_euryale.AAC.1